jgi:nicotinamidase/pyrazinamidase
METARKEALIVVDYQKDFIEGGSLGVTGAAALAPEINRLIAEFRTKSGLIIATRDWHPNKTVHFDAWPIHCVAGSAGAEYGEIDTSAISVEIFKGFMNANDGYSGFEGVTALVGDAIRGFEKVTGAKTLEEVLAESRIRVVRIVGLATDYCIKATAIDAAKFRDKGGLDRVVVESSGIAAVNITPGDGEKAIEEMKARGVEVV